MRLFNCLVIPVVLLAVSCGDDEEASCNGASVNGNTLEGSYCENIEMTFTEVRIRFNIDANALFIEYRRLYEGSGAETALQVIVDGNQVNIEANKEIDLIQSYSQVRRLLTDGNLTLTDEIDAGSTITFTQYTGEIGSELKGELHILFKSGRTLNGDFHGTILDAAKIAGN